MDKLLVDAESQVQKLKEELERTQKAIFASEAAHDLVKFMERKLMYDHFVRERKAFEEFVREREKAKKGREEKEKKGREEGKEERGECVIEKLPAVIIRLILSTCEVSVYNSCKSLSKKH